MAEKSAQNIVVAGRRSRRHLARLFSPSNSGSGEEIARILQNIRPTGRLARRRLGRYRATEEQSQKENAARKRGEKRHYPSLLDGIGPELMDTWKSFCRINTNRDVIEQLTGGPSRSVLTEMSDRRLRAGVFPAKTFVLTDVADHERDARGADRNHGGKGSGSCRADGLRWWPATKQEASLKGAQARLAVIDEAVYENVRESSS